MRPGVDWSSWFYLEALKEVLLHSTLRPVGGSRYRCPTVEGGGAHLWTSWDVGNVQRGVRGDLAETWSKFWERSYFGQVRFSVRQ